MLKARLLGALATVALMMGAAACDSPTAVTGREAGLRAATIAPSEPAPGEAAPSQAELDAAEADSLAAEYTLAGDSLLALSLAPATGATETYIIPLGPNRIFNLTVPVGSTVTVYPDKTNPNIKHIVVKLPDGTIIHYIWDPANPNVMKKFVKPASTTASPSTGTLP